MRLLKEVRNLTGNYHVKSGMFHYFRGEYRQAEEFFELLVLGELLFVKCFVVSHFVLCSLFVVCF